MTNIRDVYGKFADEILKSVEMCECDAQSLNYCLSKFESSGVLPRALLYNAIQNSLTNVAREIEQRFAKEIGKSLLKYAEDKSIQVSIEEVEKEIEVWKEIWETQSRNRA
jgi:hypothetical protein